MNKTVLRWLAAALLAAPLLLLLSVGYTRWRWWPGNAVERAELQRELQTLHDAGFSGVELQTLTIGMPQQHLREHESAIY